MKRNLFTTNAVAECILISTLVTVATMGIPSAAGADRGGSLVLDQLGVSGTRKRGT